MQNHETSAALQIHTTQHIFLTNFIFGSGQTVHGGLTSWGNWSTCDCDHSTGTGTRNRTRSCTNPAPSCYGRLEDIVYRYLSL